jgi:hypothetical protein
MDTELRERIKDFWLELGEQEHRNLVSIQKDAVLKVMMKQMEHSCACAVCQQKRLVAFSTPRFCFCFCFPFYFSLSLSGSSPLLLTMLSAFFPCLAILSLDLPPITE